MAATKVSELEAIARYRNIIEAELELDEIDYGNTPGLRALHVVARAGELTIAKDLLQKKANVNFCTSKGLTPLHYAVLSGKVSMVQLLILYGGEVDSQSLKDGKTPLFTAAEKGEFDIVKCLLDSGANPLLCSYEGVYPKDAALAMNFTRTLALLENSERRYQILQANRNSLVDPFTPLSHGTTFTPTADDPFGSINNQREPSNDPFGFEPFVYSPATFADDLGSPSSAWNPFGAQEPIGQEWNDPAPPYDSDPPPTYAEVMEDISSQNRNETPGGIPSWEAPSDEECDDTTALLGDS